MPDSAASRWTQKEKADAFDLLRDSIIKPMRVTIMAAVLASVIVSCVISIPTSIWLSSNVHSATRSFLIHSADTACSNILELRNTIVAIINTPVKHQKLSPDQQAAKILVLDKLNAVKCNK